MVATPANEGTTSATGVAPPGATRSLHRTAGVVARGARTSSGGAPPGLLSRRGADPGGLARCSGSPRAATGYVDCGRHSFAPSRDPRDPACRVLRSPSRHGRGDAAAVARAACPEGPRGRQRCGSRRLQRCCSGWRGRRHRRGTRGPRETLMKKKKKVKKKKEIGASRSESRVNGAARCGFGDWNGSRRWASARQTIIVLFPGSAFSLRRIASHRIPPRSSHRHSSSLAPSSFRRLHSPRGEIPPFAQQPAKHHSSRAEDATANARSAARAAARST